MVRVSENQIPWNFRAQRPERVAKKKLLTTEAFFTQTMSPLPAKFYTVQRRRTLPNTPDPMSPTMAGVSPVAWWPFPENDDDFERAWKNHYALQPPVEPAVNLPSAADPFNVLFPDKRIADAEARRLAELRREEISEYRVYEIRTLQLGPIERTEDDDEPVRWVVKGREYFQTGDNQTPYNAVKIGGWSPEYLLWGNIPSESINGSYTVGSDVMETSIARRQAHLT